MTYRLLSPDQFQDLAQSTVDWARMTLKQLDLVDSQCEQSRRAAVQALDGREHRLEVVKGSPTSVLAGCVAVRLPGSMEQPSTFVMALQRHAAWQEQAAPVLVHATALRAALAEGVRGVSGTPRKGLFRRNRPEESTRAVDRLNELKDWAEKTEYSASLRTLAERGPAHPDRLDPAHGLASLLNLPPPKHSQLPVIPSDAVATLQAVLARGTDLLETRERLGDQVRNTFATVRERMVVRQLEKLPVTLLKEAMSGPVRVSALEDAGVCNIQQVLDRAKSLARIPGISPQSATQVVATAESLRRTAQADLRLNIDLDESDALLTQLVSSLHVLLEFEARMEKHRDELHELVTLLAPLRSLPSAADGDVVLLHARSPRRGADLTRHLLERVDWVSDSGVGALLGDTAPAASLGAPSWQDFKRRAAEYYGLLSELVGITADVDAAQGHLTLEVVEAVDRQQLDTSRLKVSLRGYQDFGARYALVQRRVLVGDEMGLGKTIQALAVMSHLSANGAQHFLVVCPSAVLVNWIREIRKHSQLEPMRIHGPSRDQEWRRWRSRGGVAVTSYDTLYRLPESSDPLDLLVVDEAHLVKNPRTRRTGGVRDYISRSGRTLMLTGTPLENRVEDLRNLVSYLQPAVAEGLVAEEILLGAHKFREAVAPVYLRRNSDDVLSELPDLVETEEWSEFTDVEREAYLDALQGERPFERLRRVAFTADPSGSSKLERLEELVDEATANGFKVLIFSYFHDVLEAVAERLGAHVIGTITGSVSPDRRQAMADAFTESALPKVLLSQIDAGGVGMNLQAASVVILCEPQVKPAREAQAIKRAHRIGQVRSVQVHRLLTADSVDERMLAIVAAKAELFEEYAGQSAVVGASPSAVATTDTAVVKQVLAQEQERYADQLRARRKSASAAAPPPATGEDSDLPDLGDDSPVEDPLEDGRVTQSPPTVTPKPSSASRDAAARYGPQRVVPQAEPAVHKCHSCNRPYDVNGHCGCS